MTTEYSDQLVIGLDVGGTGLKAAVIDHQGAVLMKEQRPTLRELGSEAVIANILDFAYDLAKKSRDPAGADRVVAVGVAVPGLIDEENGVVLTAVNLKWKNMPLRRLLEERLGIPVVVGHDVRTASIAEGLLGAARGCEDYLLLTIGTGIGGAVVLRGVPYVGVHNLSGEFGHMVVQPGGPLCSCGRHGCIEILASASAVIKRYRSMTQASADMTTRDVAERVAAGDATAIHVWDEAIEALSIGIANYINLLDPERVVIGGGMADAGRVLFEPLNVRLAREPTLQPAPRVLPAVLGNDAGYLGAALNAWLTLGVSRAELTWSRIG